MSDLNEIVRTLGENISTLEAGAKEARRQFDLRGLSDEAVIGSIAYILAAMVSAPKGDDQ